jgi:hypothetical protein
VVPPEFEARGNIGFVRSFVFAETGIPVYAEDRFARVKFYFRRDVGHTVSQRSYEALHRKAKELFILMSVSLKPRAIVVSFQAPQEIETSFWKSSKWRKE